VAVSPTASSIRAGRAVRGDKVVIRDVGPRDGLQNVSGTVSTADKVAMIEGLAAAGVTRIEVGSFVSAKAVPAMADSPAVFEQITRLDGVRYEALVVNAAGAARALEVGADELCIAIAVSETFSQRNVRTSVAEALDEVSAIVAVATAAGVACSAGVSSVFGCVFEGKIEHQAVVDLASSLIERGVGEIMLADTTGMAAPSDVRTLVPAVRAAVGQATTLGLHFHNTRGLALANVTAGLEVGVVNFDTSLGGLGGCPFAPGATGNVATEEVVHLLALEGYETDIDLDALIATAQGIEAALGATLPSQVLRAGPRWRGQEPW